MRTLPAIIALSLLGCGGARTTEVVSAEGKGAPGYAPSVYVPAGTVLPLALAEDLSGRDVEPGDRFVAHVAEPVIGPSGELVLPEGTPVSGHVAAIRDADARYPASMALAFDAIHIDGTSAPFAANVLRSAVTTNQTDIEASDVGIGAAIGAVVGTIIDPGEGTLAGAGIGAGGGALVSLGRSRDEAILPAGTILVVRLEEPIQIGGGPLPDEGGEYPPAPPPGFYEDPRYDEPLY